MNLGNPGEFTIRQLAETVVEMTGARSRLVHRPLPQDDPRQRRPDLARAEGRARLGALHGAPKDGLVRTIAYFRSLLDVPDAVARPGGGGAEPGRLMRPST